MEPWRIIKFDLGWAFEITSSSKTTHLQSRVCFSIDGFRENLTVRRLQLYKPTYRSVPLLRCVASFCSQECFQLEKKKIPCVRVKSYWYIKTTIFYYLYTHRSIVLSFEKVCLHLFKISIYQNNHYIKWMLTARKYVQTEYMKK